MIAQERERDLDQQSDASLAYQQQSTTDRDRNQRRQDHEYSPDASNLPQNESDYDDGHQDMDFLQDLEAIAAQPPVSPLARSGPSIWQKRRQGQQNAFIALRPTLLKSHLVRHALPQPGSCCSICHSIAHVVCLDCDFPGSKLLCGKCDAAAHPHAHLHRRQSIPSGCLLPLHPLRGFDAQGREEQRGGASMLLLFALAGCDQPGRPLD